MDAIPPIILIDGDDVQLFPTEFDLANYLEPVDVRAGAFGAYDAVGRKLTLTASEKEVSVSSSEENPLAPDELAQSLRHYLGPIVGNGSLPELIEKVSTLQHGAPMGFWPSLKRLFSGRM